VHNLKNRSWSSEIGRLGKPCIIASWRECRSVVCTVFEILPLLQRTWLLMIFRSASVWQLKLHATYVSWFANKRVVANMCYTSYAWSANGWNDLQRSGIIREATCDFLSVSGCTYVSILYHFGDSFVYFCQNFDRSLTADSLKHIRETLRGIYHT